MESESIPRILKRCRGTNLKPYFAESDQIQRLEEFVQIRLEDDKEVIKDFTPEQKESENNGEINLPRQRQKKNATISWKQ